MYVNIFKYIYVLFNKYIGQIRHILILHEYFDWIYKQKICTLEKLINIYTIIS